MRRYLPALLVVISAGVLIAGLLELNTRQEDSFVDLGVGEDEPSALASPSPTPFSPGAVSTPQPTPAETIPLSPSPDGITGAQETPAPTEVPEATPTTSPVDGVAAGPTRARGEPMPVTGGGAFLGGGLVLAAAGLLRALSLVRLR